jgi:EAL domain-containing protein (putative c-di-GMP-specific phosphodiesterase class I)
MSAQAKFLSKSVERHAFVVDDDPQFRAFIAKALGGMGFATHEMSQLPEVETALATYNAEVIVLDLSLGETDAVEVLRSIGASLFGGKVLLISGNDTTVLNEVQNIGARLGIVMLPFLSKPCRLEELKKRIATLAGPTGAPADNIDLESALRNNWLELWYQPKINLKSGLLCGAEALIRLRHPERGIIPPSAFLPPSGDPLYEPLTDFVVRRSLADWSSFADKKITCPLAINAPISILQNPGFTAKVRRHLPKHGAFPGLTVEITEDEAISDPELARETAIRLKLYNINMALDDFGIGYSVLSRLDELPFEEIKLDRKFVSGCSTNEKKRLVCQNIVLLARRFNMTAVAEGVETAEDLRVLIEMGYDVAQGFYFANPVPSSVFINMALSWTVKTTRRIEAPRPREVCKAEAPLGDRTERFLRNNALDTLF